MNRHQHEIQVLREQLAALRQQYSRCSGIAFDVIASFHETFRRACRQDHGAFDASLQLSDVLLIPLSVKQQQIEISPSDAMRSVIASVLCADASDVVAIELEFEGGCTVWPELNQNHETAESRDNAETQLRSLQLIAGEPRRLLDCLPHREKGAFRLRRIGGELCLLRLEIRPKLAPCESDVSSTKLAHDGDYGPRSRRSPYKGTLWKALQFWRNGRTDLAMEVALAHASDAERSAVDLLRATLVPDDDAAWLSHVNKYVEQFAIAPIRLRPGKEPRFLRLDATPTRTVSNGPVVTVIMSAFNAESTLEFAAGSILRQSWQPLELIIIDDHSSDDTWQIAQRIERLDSRVKTYRNSVNVGPYVSKNLALRIATGAYITCQDADDWAHPERIEKQVEAMRGNGGFAPACVSRCLRVDRNGAFTGFTRVGRQSDDGALQTAHVTCMIESGFMRRQVGYWDSVRFGADGEMLERLERILGDRFLNIRQLSLLALDGPTSLTNHSVHGISRISGLSPTRRAYRDGWRQWHETLSPDNAYIDFPQTVRPFLAPAECAVSPDEVLRLVHARGVSA